jgi:hypothetical protein
MNCKDIPNPVVVVPVHRPKPTPDEQISLRRCFEVLSAHPIWIVHPEDLSLEPYQELLPSAVPLPVPTAWMGSIRAYNRMMINPTFYQMLAQFSHALIHEPDALVISDQLLFWCEQPYDYIGAPWFQGYHSATPDASIIGVGNSGFSLINLSAIRSAFNSNSRWISRMTIVKEITKKLLRRTSCYKTRFLLKAFGPDGLLRYAHRVVDSNCDLFISTSIPSVRADQFTVADVQAAVRFSWEVNPVKCAELCNNCPPFGVHAWSRYDRHFIERLLHSVSPS